MRQMSLFAGLDKSALEFLDGLLDRKAYFNNDIICTEGTMTDELYLIESGKVDILKQGIKVGQLNEGNSFGEMSMIEMKERSADVVASGEVVLYILKREKLFQLRDLEPLIYADIMYNLCKDLSNKLRDVTSRLQRIWSGYINIID